MHRHDGTSSGRYSRFDLRYIDIASLRIRVHEYRGGTRQPDRFRGRKEGIRRSDDLVARAKTQGEKHKQQRVGA